MGRNETRDLREQAQEQLNRLLSEGTRLANSNVTLFEGRSNGRRHRVTMADCVGGRNKIADPMLRAGTALMLENLRRKFGSMDESTKSVQIGNFEKYAYPIIRAVFPNLIAHELVSVQPQPTPNGLFFFMKFLYNATKGKVAAGQDLIEQPDYNYSAETIEEEALATGDAATVNFTGNFTWLPLRPGTLAITDGVQTITDDGNGNLIGDVGVGTNTVNYATGAFDLDFTAAPGAGDPITANYEYVMEGNDQLPEVDLVMSSSTAIARPRKLRTKWSIEAAQDLKAVQGLEAEVELVAAITNELKFEVDQDIIRDLLKIATGTVSAWSKTVLAGTSYTEHKLSFVDKLVEASNKIYEQTQRAVGGWVVAGLNVMNIVETLPGWKPSGQMSGRGIFYAGDFGQWKFFKNAYMPALGVIAGADRFLVGYKGTQMFETGYCYGPYEMFYATPTVMLDDFQARKGIATRYAKKAIDGRFYVKGSIAA